MELSTAPINGHHLMYLHLFDVYGLNRQAFQRPKIEESSPI